MTEHLPKIFSPYSILRRKRRDPTYIPKQTAISADVQANLSQSFGVDPDSAVDQIPDDEQFVAPRYHLGLLQSLEIVPETSIDELISGIIPQSVGLQTKEGEKEYRSARPVHNSPTIPVSCNGGRRRTQLRESEPAGGPAPPLCCMPSCRLIGIPDHMEKFQHLCQFGDLCTRFLERDPSHCRHYKHLPLHTPEPRRDSPLPSFAAAQLQSFQPRLSCCPRAGHRPLGGSPQPPELRALRPSPAAGAPSDDAVPLLIRGLSVYWTAADLERFVRSAAGPHLLPVSVDLIFAGPAAASSTGTAVVRMASHAEAAALRLALHGRSFADMPGAGVVTAEYVHPVPLPHDAPRPPSGPGRRWGRAGGAGAAALRFHRAIRECGPYWADAEALFERMREEGHAPDAAACRELIRCYRGAPPSPPPPIPTPPSPT